MKKVYCLVSLLALISLTSCEVPSFLSSFQKENPNAPTYTGMSIVEEQEKAYKGLKLYRDSEKEGFLLHKNEEFFFEIHFDNPSRYEIQSFTIDGVKYASYMFEEGSTLENLYLKSKAPDSYEDLSYTIDSIKYIDGSKIKDAKIKGNQTIEAKVVPYSVLIESTSEEKGKVFGGGQFDHGDSVTVNAVPEENCVFKGWFEDSECTTLVSNELTYTFKVELKDVHLYAKFLTHKEDIFENVVELSDEMIHNGLIMDFTSPTWRNVIIPSSSREISTFVYSEITFNCVDCAVSGSDSPFLFMRNKATIDGQNVSWPDNLSFIGNKYPFSKPIKRVEVQINGNGSSQNTIYRILIGNEVFLTSPTEGGVTGKYGETITVTSDSEDSYFFVVGTNLAENGHPYNGQILKISVFFE